MLKEIIYKTLEDSNKQWIPVNHNPSSASFKYKDGRVIGPDLLTSFLKWTGVKPSNPADAKALLKMKLGDGTHLVISQILAKAGIKFKSEVPGKMIVAGLKNPVSYRVDGEFENDDTLQILETKSTTDTALLGKGWGIKDKGPKMEHILQIICYLNLEPGVSKTTLLYISRDSGELLEYLVQRLSGDRYTINGKETPELSWAGIIERWKQLEEALKTSTIPNPEHKAWINDKTMEVMPVKQIDGKSYKTDWEVTYSPYKDHIWKNPANYKFTYNQEFKEKGLLK